MKDLEFPIIGTKVKGLTKKFDLNSPQGRKAYFEAKTGDEIKHIKEFLDEKTFMAFLLGKKNSGKSTYVKLFMEIFGEDKIEFVSVGDVVREVSSNWDKFKKSEDFDKLKGLYRGYISFDDAVNAFLGRSTAKLLPTEFIMALLKLKISKLDLKGKSMFIDGLPRETDQVSYSLYFRDLAGYTDSQDLFILIDIPEAVIDERIKHRVVCPICATSRNNKLLITSKIEYDKKTKKFDLICDNPACKGAVMQAKEGDDKGLEPIRGRLIKDEEILKRVFALHGIPKILLRNHVPVKDADKYYDKYEITPEYVLSWNEKENKVEVTERPWSVNDDNGEPCFSLLAAPVVIPLLKQMVEVLED
jgi:adenylate kinase family enzyme